MVNRFLNSVTQAQLVREERGEEIQQMNGRSKCPTYSGESTGIEVGGVCRKTSGRSASLPRFSHVCLDPRLAALAAGLFLASSSDEGLGV